MKVGRFDVSKLTPRSLRTSLLYRLGEYRKRRRRAFWENRVGPGDELIIRLPPGVRLRLFGDSALSALIYYGDFEVAERHFLLHFLRPGDIFVDVGANIGLFTVIAGQVVGPAGQVWALEPAEKTWTRLLGNVRLNGLSNVNCRRLALSDADGELDLNVSADGFDAWNSFGTPAAGSVFDRQRVSCATWDRLAQELGLVGRVALMKVDVEGWEAHVLGGGAQALSRTDAPVLLVEFTDEACRGAGSTCKALYGALENLGYRLHLYDPGRRTLIHDPVREHYPYLNLVAAKRPQEVCSRLVAARS